MDPSFVGAVSEGNQDNRAIDVTEGITGEVDAEERVFMEVDAKDDHTHSFEQNDTAPERGVSKPDPKIQ